MPNTPDVDKEKIEMATIEDDDSSTREVLHRKRMVRTFDDPGGWSRHLSNPSAPQPLLQRDKEVCAIRRLSGEVSLCLIDAASAPELVIQAC